MNAKIIIGRKSFPARVALILTALAIPFIFVGKFSLLSNLVLRNIPLVTEVIMPLIGCVLFIITIILLGRVFFAISFLPVALCMIPVILQALKTGTLIGIGEVVICFLAIILYTCTVFGALKIKIIPILIFIVEVVYRLYFYIYKTIVAGGGFGVQDAFYHVAILYMLVAFIFALIGLDQKIKVTSTGKEVVPPIPGSNTLGQAPDPVFSDPAPAIDNSPEADIPQIPTLAVSFEQNDEVKKEENTEENNPEKNEIIDTPFIENAEESNSEDSFKEENKNSFQRGILSAAEKIKLKFIKNKEINTVAPHEIEKGAEEIGQIEE